jgi:hypothetical protein
MPNVTPRPLMTSISLTMHLCPELKHAASFTDRLGLLLQCVSQDLARRDQSRRCKTLVANQDFGR